MVASNPDVINLKDATILQAFSLSWNIIVIMAIYLNIGVGLFHLQVSSIVIPVFVSAEDCSWFKIDWHSLHELLQLGVLAHIDQDTRVSLQIPGNIKAVIVLEHWDDVNLHRFRRVMPILFLLLWFDSAVCILHLRRIAAAHI